MNSIDPVPVERDKTRLQKWDFEIQKQVLICQQNENTVNESYLLKIKQVNVKLPSATSFKFVLHQSDLGARNHRRKEEEEGPPLRVHAGEAGPPQGGFISINLY